MTPSHTSELKPTKLVLPTFLAAVAATRLAPLAVPALIVLLCYLPGRTIVEHCALARGWGPGGRRALSLAASLAITPVMLNPIWHVSNNGWFLLAMAWQLNLALLLTLRPAGDDSIGTGTPAAETPLFEHRSTRVLALLLLAILLVAGVGPYWPGEWAGRPVPSSIHDFVKHHAVLFSLEQRPLPLGNPFYAQEASGPVYYYHFFYLIPATIRAVASGISIELAFGLHATLVACATAVMAYVIAKRLTGGEAPAALAALLATAVGALDLIPLVIQRHAVVTLDAWADHTVRIHNLLNQMMWSPQNVLGVLIALVGVHGLSVKSWWRGWLILGPVLGAALIGSSVWVSLPVFTGLVLFVAHGLTRQLGDGKALLRRAAGALVTAALIATAAGPTLLGYAEMSGRHGKALTTLWPHQSNALLGRLVSPGFLANLLDLPWVLTVELGALVLLPLMLTRRAWRRAWNDDGVRVLILAGAAAVAGFVTIRSHFRYNDFGQKSMMVVMVAGVVLGSMILRAERGRATPLNPLGWQIMPGPSGRPRRAVACVLAVLVLLGLPVAIYEVPLTAVRRHLSPTGPLGTLAPAGTALLRAEADAYRFMRYELPQDAIILAHWDSRRANLAQLVRRQLGVTVLEADTMVFYPRDASAHSACLEAVSGALSVPGDSAECHRTLRRNGITHLFVGAIERENWGGGGLPKLSDRAWFTPIYDDGRAAVLALHQALPAAAR